MALNCNYLPMKTLFILFMSVISLVAGAGLFCGCESSGGTSGLSVSPTEVNLSSGSNNTDSVTFTVSNGSSSSNAVLSDATLPLEWSVSNPELGSIRGSGGYSAVYVATGGSGVNVITVRDQTGAEGIASVNQ